MKVEYKETRVGYVDLSGILFKDVIKYTKSDYGCIGDLVPIENIPCLIEDLLGVIYKKNDKIEELEQMYENDYDPELEIPEIHEI